MRILLIATLLVVVLISVWISYQFDITFVVIAASLLIAMKKVKLIWIFDWFIRFIFIRAPQRLLTALVQIYIIDRKTMTWILETLKGYQNYLRAHHKTKLIVGSVIALILMGALAWWIGLWLLVIYEVETVAMFVWRRIWPTLSETAFVQALERLFTLLSNTRIGRLYKQADAWLEVKLRRSAEEIGKAHKELVVASVEEVLRSFLKTAPMPPPPMHLANRFDLRQLSHPKGVSRNHCRSTKRGYTPPRPRPLR